ncbi:hypothetical protein BHM03_00030754 [Ensete ventricosum]|uniref:Uncharacterized protein n=1 Tax=Ensete ventricosum TaxID=4639 RepID=A0A426YPP7_ENSVE|nr:hypothetical protein B296_00045896 [Ensete ventricosum]RZS00970.1 hypothetical protein BHM03_00030754 [Ensete ventricosum]
MRKHGWQLPYHPLQVVAIAVFLALGFAFYVFFVPFVGKKLFQYVIMGLYTPLVIHFGLHALCTLGQLILQWSMGILVLILCSLERKRLSAEIISKLGSSFSLIPFVVVVVSY